MKKFLLTSAGFLNKKIGKKFLELCDKQPEDIRVIFVPTAARTQEELKYVDESKQELLDLGIKEIRVLNLDHKVTQDEVSGHDAIYVCGGNAFYLLKKVRESGFEKILDSCTGVYVGVSAGSIIVGPDIETAAPWDENDVHLEDTTGLQYVDFVVIPHCEEKDQRIIEKLRRVVSYEIKEITDMQATVVINGNSTII